jgi:hypothetical protein
MGLRGPPSSWSSFPEVFFGGLKEHAQSLELVVCKRREHTTAVALHKAVCKIALHISRALISCGTVTTLGLDNLPVRQCSVATLWARRISASVLLQLLLETLVFKRLS